MRLVGRYLAQRRQSGATYLQWLRASTLDALDQGERQVESVPLLLERSLQQVSRPACEALSVIGVLARRGPRCWERGDVLGTGRKMGSLRPIAAWYRLAGDWVLHGDGCREEYLRSLWVRRCSSSAGQGNGRWGSGGR